MYMDRYIFISASKLHIFWKNVPVDILNNSLFFFGSKRHWLLPEDDDEIADSKAQPTDYLSFDKELLDLIRVKEARNEVFFLKPKMTEHAGDYNKVSEWLISNGMNPLWLTDDKWDEMRDVVEELNLYGVSVDEIKHNYKTGNHFYNEVMALIKYSNEKLIPKLEMYVPDAFINDIDIPNLSLDTSTTPLKYVFEKLKLEQLDNELWLEFGVFNGSSINYISQFTPHTVYGFDSFDGLPEYWRDGHDKGEFNVDILPAVNDNVVLMKGWFDETLITFINGFRKEKKISFLHLDADLYSSTIFVLNTVKDYLKIGCVIIFDELVNYKGFDGEKGELRAWYEFIQENKNIEYEYIGMDGVFNLDGPKNHISNRTSVALKITNIN
jgi:hypothetical protein